ncbi:MAG: SUMF1/EgtB/PvdO family nonheme iron enzyme, partial [Acidobacteria bacterium]|nr:SUMF1/EgtB/PvdO family nonheme iron enzyme [Acidobacteriota bacterium]
SLCKPLDENRIIAVQERGTTIVEGLEDVEVPTMFTYVPHTLERLVTGEGGGHGGRKQALPAGMEGELPADGKRWDPFAVKELLDLLARTPPPVRILVEAPAGFGKTTFLRWLACLLAQDGGRPAPVGPLTASRHDLARGRVRDTVERWAHDACEPQEGLENIQYRRTLAAAALRRGRTVLLVDGLDQIERPEKAAANLQAEIEVARLIATCREETGLPRQGSRWTAVIRLRHPTEDDFDRLVSGEVRELLEGTIEPVVGHPSYDEDDVRHPFFIHVARVVHVLGGKELRSRTLAGLLGEYITRLFEQGKGHDTATGGREFAQDGALSDSEWEALGTLGYLSMTRLHRIPGGSGSGLSSSLQLLDGATFRNVRDIAFDRVSPRFRDRADSFFDFARAHSCLMYLLEGGHSGGEPVYTFHHQLVQEYLGAVGLALRLKGRPADSKATLLERLAPLVAGVVAPRNDDKTGQAQEIEARVTGLVFWRMLAELLTSPGRCALRPEERRDLLAAISVAILDDALDEAGQGTIAASALHRLRDELFDHDEELQSWAVENADGELADFKDDPVVAQLKKAEVPPDPFMVLCWKEERRLIQEQVASVADWLLEQGVAEKGIDRDALGQLREACASGDVDARIEALEATLQAILRHQEDRLPEDRRTDWEVRPHGPTVAAFKPEADDPSWVLVPHGPFVAGDVGFGDELPVRVVNVERPFWIAFDPVTAGEFSGFVEGRGYANDLGGACWQVFDSKELENALEGRREPLDWCEQRNKLDRPVTGLAWFEAAAYCLWRNGVTGQVEGSGGPHHLPTEAEWEKAARGLLGRRWPWGCAWRNGLAVCEREWKAEHVARVNKNPNESSFGVRGMAGNIWEWTRTGWQEEEFGKRAELGEVKTGELISMRGGSFGVVRLWMRCAYRNGLDVGDGLVVYGFRCLREVLLNDE